MVISPDLCKPSFLHGTPNRLSTNTNFKGIPCEAHTQRHAKMLKDYSENVKTFQHNPHKMHSEHFK